MTISSKLINHNLQLSSLTLTVVWAASRSILLPMWRQLTTADGLLLPVSQRSVALFPATGVAGSDLVAAGKG